MTNVIINKESSDPKKDRNTKLWQNRIESHLEWVKEHWNGWGSWRAAYLLDRAIHWGEAEKLEDKSQNMSARITVPLIAVHVRNLMPFLFSRDPKFYGYPKTDVKEELNAAKAQIDYLNHVWREQRMSKQARRTILDAAIIGHGIAKTGWGLELEPKTSDEQKKGKLNLKNHIQEESPHVQRINPFMFLFDRTAPDSDLASARWCCELVIHTMQDLVDNDLYNSTIRNKIQRGEIPVMKVQEFNAKYHEKESDEEDFSFLFDTQNRAKSIKSESPDALVLLYKVYDRKYGNVFTMIPDVYNGNDAILELYNWDEHYSHLENFPFEKVDFEEVPNELFGVGHARYLADLQHQLNRNRSKIFAITRAFNPKYLHIGDNPIDAKAKTAIKSDNFGEVVSIGTGNDLRDFPIPNTSEDLYRASAIIDRDYGELSGEGILARGGLLPSRTSAAEIRERSRLRGLRLETNVAATHEFVLNVARQVLSHAKRFATKEKVVSIIGSTGDHWRRVSPMELNRTNVDLQMEVISKPAEPPEQKRRQLFELFQIIANPNIYQLLQSQGVRINMKKLWSEIMDTFDIDEMSHIFPGLDEGILPNIDLQNPATQQGLQTPNQSNEARRSGVQEGSIQQGFEGVLESIGGGG